MTSNQEDLDDFYDKCERIISSKTLSIAPSLCYYPLGWKLNAWHEFVDRSIHKHLPEIPQYDHLLDPHQGSTKALGAGGHKMIEGTPKASQSSQITVTDLGSPLKDKSTGRGKDLEKGKGASQVISTSQIALEFNEKGGSLTQTTRARARSGTPDSDLEQSPAKRTKTDTLSVRGSTSRSTNVPATKKGGTRGRDNID
jgi:hypothetical protein